MHITCSKDKLIAGATFAMRAVSSRTTLPILECLLIETINGAIKISGNDTELAIETTPIEVTVIEPGSIAIDAKMFFDIIRRLPEKEIIIKQEGPLAYIKSGKAEFKINTQNPHEFPMLPDIEKLELYSLESATFKNMIRQTIFSLSTTEDKPALTGGLIEIENKNLTLVAVDSFRISLRKEALKDSGSDFSAIIPGKTLNELTKILPADGEVTIYFSEKHVLFEIEEAVIVSRLLEGEFLRYKQVFTAEHKVNVIANRQEVLDSLERSTIVANEMKKTPVAFTINENKLIIVSTSEAGNLYDEIDVATKGEIPLDISFNPRYLIEAIKAMDVDTISLNFNTNLSPCIITEEGDDNYKYLVLPLRTA
jgi:DNA polymerase-3 subunit beta